MSSVQAQEYTEASKFLAANEMLRDIQVADMPHMKDNSRKKISSKIAKQARLPEEEMSFEDFARKMGMTSGRKDNN